MAETDVTKILDHSELFSLREGYDRAAMIAGARGATIAPYPAAAPLVEFTIGRFYQGDAMKPHRREQVLISFFASHGGGRSLAVHLYWALMERLSVEEIADTLLLTGVYAGIDVYNGAINTFRKVLGILEAAAKNGGDATKTTAVIPQIAAAFP